VTSNPDRPGPAAPQRLPTSAYDYELPAGLIAHHPAAQRDASRLLVIDRATGGMRHRVFRDVLELIEPGDVLVLNETRVIPARLLGSRSGGGIAEFVLLHPAQAGKAMSLAAAGDWPAEWFALARPGSRLRPGRRIRIADDLHVEVLEALDDGTRRVALHSTLPVRAAVERYGRMPLPPYIERDAEAPDRERYQTVYARTEGSVAAPTAGLHFTPALLERLRAHGVAIATVLLHVGVGTFRPVETEDPEEHRMHAEWYQVDTAAADVMNAARAAGGRLWAVGTTVTRTLETVVERATTTSAPAAPSAPRPAQIRPGTGWTSLFVRPGFEFRAVDRLITNFHLPRSTLLMLVAAFAGHDLTMRAYHAAVAERYRFYSYGDAMAIL
jgi:S-adenosylmethionine:tRNA ribosyltransferase-isomerase